MDIKSRIEALLLAANRPLSIIDFKEMLEISSEEGGVRDFECNF